MNLHSERGIIQPPNLDDRTWQDLVDEMTALIPRYAPQWTDHNPSDLGMTLIELFAWLVEQLIYRLNRVPEKNYVAFLKLLGIPREPPAPARTFLTFAAPQAGPEGVKVCKGTQAQTLGSEREAPVVFETDEEVTVLPVNLKEVLVFDGKHTVSIREQFGLPPGKGYELAVVKGDTAYICLGFDGLSTESLKLRMMFSRPLMRIERSEGGEPIQAKITWLYSTGKDTKPDTWTPIFNGIDLSSEQRLQRDGVIELKLPVKVDNLEIPWVKSDAVKWVDPTATGQSPLFWVGIKIENTKKDREELGIHFILFNSASAHNALTVEDKELRAGDESDYQVHALSHHPLFQQPDSADPYGHLEVKVAEKRWTRVSDLMVDLDQENPEKVYVIDPVVGQIRFGGRDRLPDPVTGRNRSRGARPTGKITATYRYVAGGASGNVVAGKVVVVLTKLTCNLQGVSVTNPMAATGGRDEEPIDEALRRAPGLLRTRNRAITAEDYEYLTREAAPEVHIVRCLAAPNPSEWKKAWAGLDRSPGMVNLIIVPTEASPDDTRPTPTPDLIRRVQGYLDERRDLTANLVVNGPCYLPVKVDATVFIWKKAQQTGIKPSDLELSTKEKIKYFLHPTRGGPGGLGWQVGQHVLAADLFRAIMPPADVGYIESLTVESGTPAYKPSDRPVSSPKGATVRVADYELICSDDEQHTVTINPEPRT